MRIVDVWPVAAVVEDEHLGAREAFARAVCGRSSDVLGADRFVPGRVGGPDTGEELVWVAERYRAQSVQAFDRGVGKLEVEGA
jgi:hypothetical protein